MAQEALHSQNQDLIDLNATKDKFFSIIAHDLRGPVGSMHSLLELISEPEIQLDEEKHLELLNVMKEVSKTTFNLLENLLIWANSQRGSIEFSPKYYDLHKLVELNISLFRQVTLNKQISVINHVKTGCVRFFDYNMINTVIRNLVNNAIKFSHTNGKISVSAVETPGYLKVTVKDSGTGMKPSTIDQLFKIDTVSKSMKGTNGESGTGLGLLLCKEFVLKHSGDIMVESEPEKGSSFSFTIPNKLLV
jgi:signal transduction histidine kinase